MSERNKHPICILALAPNAVATAIGISTDKVRKAILAGDLPVYQHGQARRVLISDVETWIRSWHKTKGPSHA
jgi:excisionase family DNA binding protein